MGFFCCCSTHVLYFNEKRVINVFLRFLFIHLTIVTTMNTKSSAFVLVIFSSSMRCECFSIIHQLPILSVIVSLVLPRKLSHFLFSAVLEKGFVSESSDGDLKPCRVVLEFNYPSSRMAT